MRPWVERQSTHLWACHRAFYDPSDDRENGATNATAGDLAEQRTDIQSAAAAGEQRLQQLTEESPADRSRDRVAEHAEAIILERCASCVAADRARYQLDNESDQAFSHDRLLELARLSPTRARCKDAPAGRIRTRCP